MQETLGEIPKGVVGFEDALFTIAILQFVSQALVQDFVVYEYLWRGRAEKMQNLQGIFDKTDSRIREARIIGLMQRLVDAPKVQNSALKKAANALMRHIKYNYYAKQRLLPTFVPLDSSAAAHSIFPVYMRSCAHSARYGKTGRALIRLFTYMLSFGKIKR